MRGEVAHMPMQLTVAEHMPGVVTAVAVLQVVPLGAPLKPDDTAVYAQGTGGDPAAAIAGALEGLASHVRAHGATVNEQVRR